MFTGIVSFFYSITGKLQDKKETEQREALLAKLKYYHIRFRSNFKLVLWLIVVILIFY